MIKQRGLAHLAEYMIDDCQSSAEKWVDLPSDITKDVVTDLLREHADRTRMVRNGKVINSKVILATYLYEKQGEWIDVVEALEDLEYLEEEPKVLILLDKWAVSHLVIFYNEIA